MVATEKCYIADQVNKTGSNSTVKSRVLVRLDSFHAYTAFYSYISIYVIKMMSQCAYFKSTLSSN